MVGDPEDRFSRDEAQIILIIILPLPFLPEILHKNCVIRSPCLNNIA